MDRAADDLYFRMLYDQVQLPNRDFDQDLLNATVRIAAINGEEGIVRKLLDQPGASPFSSDKDGKTPLHHAAAGGHCAVMKILLERDQAQRRDYIDAGDMQGRTPLYYSVSSGFGDVAHLLITVGANLDARNRYGQTLLHQLAACGNDTAVRFLFEVLGKPKINIEDYNSKTPLYAAAENGRVSMAHLLVKYGADWNAKNRAGQTMLHKAAEAGGVRAIQPLLKIGLDPLAATRRGETPLYIAAQYERKEFVKELLTTYGNTLLHASVQDTKGWGPLHYAASQGCINVVHTLASVAKEARIDLMLHIDELDSTGRPPLYLAAQAGNHEIVKLLKFYGANIELCDSQGQTLLHRAIREGDAAAASVLAICEARLSTQDSNGNTPLHIARGDAYDAVEELLKLEAGRAFRQRNKLNRNPLHEVAASDDSAAKILGLYLEYARPRSLRCLGDKNQEIPLHLAVSKGNIEMVRRLLHEDSLVKKQITAKDNGGETALHKAARHGHAVIAQLLLEKGSDEVECDIKGRIPLHTAARGGESEVIKVFKSRIGLSKVTWEEYQAVWDNDHKTPHDLAVESGDEATIMLFIEPNTLWTGTTDLLETLHPEGSEPEFEGLSTEYDDGASDASSDISDVESIYSVQSLASSQSSISESVSVYRGACEKLAEILCEDADLHRLYSEAIERLSRDNFNRLHDNVLKEFFRDLRSETGDVGLHLQVVRFLRRRSERQQVTGLIHRICDPNSNNDNIQFTRTLQAQKESRDETLNRFLKSRDQTNTAVHVAEISERSEEINLGGDIELDDDDTSDEEEDETKPPPVKNLSSVTNFLIYGKSFQSLKSNLFAFLHPPATIPAALELGNIRALQRLLAKRFDRVAIGEYFWIRELDDGGYSADEIAAILMEDAADTPWIYFESRASSQPADTDIDTYPKDGVHVSRCVHQCFDHLAGETKLHEVPRDIDMDTSISEIQELCGLTDIIPSSHELERWNGTVVFQEENSIAIVSYPGLRTLEKLVIILRHLCTAANHMQASSLCCDSFTVLVHQIHQLETEDKIPPINICSIKLSLIWKLLVGVKGSDIHTLAVEPTLSSLRSCLLPILQSTEDNLFRDIPHNSPDEILNVLSLTVQFLSLGLLSYNQGHAGPIYPFFLDTPQQKIILTGTNPYQNESHCIALELTNLTCIGDMIGSPVLAFRAYSSVTNALNYKEKGSFDIFATAEDLLDTWGPGDLVIRGVFSPSLYAIKICGGIISPNTEENSMFHWSNSTRMNRCMKSPFSPRVKIRVGSPVEINGSCVLDQNECWENSNCVFENLEVHRDHWKTDEKQFGAQAGNYFLLQANRAKHKIPGKTWKQEILEQEPNMLVPYLNCLCGLQVSFCTGVARRVTLGQLIADVFLIFVDRYFTEELLQDHLDNIIHSLQNNTFRVCLKNMCEKIRNTTLSIVQKIVSSLRSTGIDVEKKFLSVAWLLPDNEGPIQCLRILCNDKSKTNSWVHVLADSEDCATFAYISTSCLVTPEVQCQGSSPRWHSTTPLLETSVFQHSSGSAQPVEPLDNRKVYFFQKMDTSLKVTVSRQVGSTIPALHITPSIIPARFARRLRGISGNPWIRIRERQKQFETSAELVVVLAETKQVPGFRAKSVINPQNQTPTTLAPT
ncbi:hypothetical protein TWF679_002637 [Orbilia oligospora]|uniref:Protein ssh4 n=1 Tax=Orbilia oligospora TaxID=2813651 RepID=A0A8H8UT03_ORBOL|nr:hypothetical protein TWF679_002637 [Orbilia oligospora]